MRRRVWSAVAALILLLPLLTLCRVEAHVTKCPAPLPVPCQPTGISMSRAWKVYFHAPDGRAGWVTVDAEDYAAAGAQAPSGTVVDEVVYETFTLGEVHWRDTE